MKNIKLMLSVLATFVAVTFSASAQEREVRLGWCTPVIDVSAGAPFAIANEFGWFKEKGISVRLIPLGGSGDCMQAVATGQILAAFAAPEAVAVMATKGAPVQIYYTGFNRNMFGLAVPVNSPVKTYADLKDKRIGVVSMGSVGVVIARSVIERAGLNPDTDVKIVVSGAPAQSKNLLENGEVAALSMWDMFYATVSSAGLPLRKIPDSGIDNFPSNGIAALTANIQKDGDILAAVARGYQMGTIFARDNPDEAVRLFLKHFPQARAAGLELEDDVKRNLPTLKAAVGLWARPDGQKEWGHNNPKVYQSYIDWLVQRKVFEAKLTSDQLINNSLISKINDFDEKKASKPK
jgi:NitT/TauT family transport system substrate-binding protein